MASSTILNEFGTPYEFAHAANRSNRRGPQYAVRNDDIQRLITATDRKTLASLSARLYANVGVIAACIDQKADFSVGEAWLPSYIGATDKEKGKPVAKFLHDVWYPQCDVRGGVFDWWKVLELCSIAIDRDGDVFLMMIKEKRRDGSFFPHVQIIPGHRVGNDYMSAGSTILTDGQYKGLRMVDGIVYLKNGRPAAYNVNFGTDGNKEWRLVPASDIIHLFDPKFSEAGRGLPAFTHALEDMKMSLASTEDERVRQQIISRLHLTVFNETGGPDGFDPLTALGEKGSSNEGVTTKSFPGGILYMPNDGSRVDQMKHDNPGVVWESFQDRLIRMSVVGVGWAMALVWKGPGQGTAERTDIVKARRAIVKRQGILFTAARRLTAWSYSVFYEGKRVPLLNNPTAWDFSRPPRLSVDDGREVKMELDQVITGTMNLSEVLEARGLNEDEFLMSRAWSVAKRKAIARQVSEEASKAYGVEVEVEDREMFMQTPNEMSSENQSSQTSQPDKPDDNQDDQNQ